MKPILRISILLLFIILIYENVNAQAHFVRNKTPLAGDTVFIVVTNRIYDTLNPDLLFGNFTDKGANKVMMVWYVNKTWQIQMLTSLQQGVDMLGKSKNWLVHIHGDGQHFPSMAYRAAGIQTLYDVNLIVYDIPTRMPGYGRIKNFYNSRKNIKKSTSQLCEFINMLSDVFHDNDSVSLHLHSLGTFAFKRCSAGKSLPLSPNFFDNIIIDAPAVKKAGHKSWVESLQYQNNIFITYNRGDRTLKGAGLITFSTQLGLKGGNRKAANARYIDFSKAAYGFHNYYLDPRLINHKPEVKHFYRSLFNGKVPEAIP
ncbi:MAG: alpha/beta hydrolase [Cytophagaceae bacterium]